MKKKIIFINSHPIQYFAPLYKYMNEKCVKTACWYCSDETLKGSFDQEFGIKVKWDVPLLEGYDFRFFKNYSCKPSYTKGFFGLINIGMIRSLFTIPKSVIVVHGYHYCTLICMLLLGKFCGHTMCLRCEMPNNQEILKSGLPQRAKRAILKHLLFPRISYFLYIGEQNRLFYKSYNISDSRLVFCPYSVDNARFQNEYATLSQQTSLIRQQIGIPPTGKVIVFSAKYIDKKRPLDILHAFAKLNHEQTWLLMVGEGELRGQMETFIETKKLRNVILTGFVNQSKIAEYYAISDLFVMCSGIGETWGLSANEAMNFNLPLILSDLSGSSIDLVEEGVNGYTFKTGDINDLTAKLKSILLDNSLTKKTSSVEIVNRYSYDTILKNMNMLTTLRL